MSLRVNDIQGPYIRKMRIHLLQLIIFVDQTLQVQAWHIHEQLVIGAAASKVRPWIGSEKTSTSRSGNKEITRAIRDLGRQGCLGTVNILV